MSVHIKVLFFWNTTWLPRLKEDRIKRDVEGDSKGGRRRSNCLFPRLHIIDFDITKSFSMSRSNFWIGLTNVLKLNDDRI